MTLLRGMASKSLRDWKTNLSHAEFACNRTYYYATSQFLFEVCCGLNPLTPLDLIPIPQESKVNFKAEEIAKDMESCMNKGLIREGEWAI